MRIAIAGRRIALIGGAGFIGHHLALRLAEQGAHVHVIDSLRVNNLHSRIHSSPATAADNLRMRMLRDRFAHLRAARIPLIVRDARNHDTLAHTLARIVPQTIVHLAAVAHANRANEDPLSAFEHSLHTLANALACARTARVEHFVYLSSSMVYGNFLTDAVDEDHPLNPIGIYGALKLAAEKMVIAHQQAFDLPYTIVRPSALYGPRCVSGRVAQRFIENALRRLPLRVDGDGSDKLDFTYIDDLVDGLARVIAYPAARNATFNLTYGQGRTIAELAALVQESLEGAIVRHAERDKLMPSRGTLSIERARRILGYAPEVPIEAGIPQYIRWYREWKWGAHSWRKAAWIEPAIR